MKFIIKFFSLFLFISFLACNNVEQDPLLKAESDFESVQNDTTYAALMNQYLNALKEAADDQVIAKPILLKALNASEKINKPVDEIGFLNSLIVNNFSDENTAIWMLKMADLLKSINKADASSVIYSGITRSFPTSDEAKVASQHLPKDFTTMESFIDIIGTKMFVKEKNELDSRMAANFVDACEAFAMTVPNDPNAVIYLHKAAETARTMKTIDKAISLYDWIIKKYPNHEKAPQALFLKAFTYDNNLGNIEEARVLYQEFLEKYPKDDFADDTQFLLDNLGKSDEEILKALTAKNKK